MAEPASALVALSSAIQLVAACLEVSTFLQKIPSNYKQSLGILRSIEAEVGIFAAAVGHVREWLEKTAISRPEVDDPRIQGVNNALNQFNESMRELRRTLEKFSAKENASNATGAWSRRWIRTKFVFQEDTLKLHLGELRQQAALVQFTLTALQLHASVAETKVTFESIAVRAKTIRRTCAKTQVDSSDEVEYQCAEVTTGCMARSGQAAPPGSAPYPMTPEEIEAALPGTSSPSHKRPTDSDTVKPTYPGQQTYPARPRNLRPVGSEEVPSSSSTNNGSKSSTFVPQEMSRRPTATQFQGQHPESRPLMPPSDNIAQPNISEVDVVRLPMELPGSVPILPNNQRLATPIQIDATPPTIVRKPTGASRSQSHPSADAHKHKTGESTGMSKPDDAVHQPLNGRSTRATTLPTGISDSGNSDDPPPPFTPFANSATSLNPSSDGYGYHSGLSESPQISTAVTEKTRPSPSCGSEAPELLQAVCEGSASAVERALASGAAIEAIDPKTGRTALGEASMKGRVGIVQILLSHHCNPNALDAEMMAPLHYAAQKGYDNVATALLDGSALVNFRGPDDVSPLHLAAEAGHINMVSLLLRRKADSNAKSVSQRSALHAAAFNGFSDMCTLLMDNGAHIHDKDLEDKTAVQLAAEAGHINLVNYLLSRATYQATDPFFTAPVFAAIESGNVRMVEEMLDKGKSIKRLIKGLKEDAYKPATLAAKSGNLAMLELMIKNKAKLKDRDPKGWTALQHAAHHGHTHIITRLADTEIPTKTITSKKETPLHLAAQASQYHAFTTLLKGKGASQTTTKDTHGNEPLHAAARADATEITSHLFSLKAPMNNTNSFGWTPLHIAIAHNNTSTVTQLLSLGINIEDRLSTPNNPDPKGARTHSLVEQGFWAEAHYPFPGSKPLHLAIEFRRDDIARLLVARGAKTDAACGNGWRPLHLAAFTSSPAMVEMLLEAGAHPHAVTGMVGGKTALDVAVWRAGKRGGFGSGSGGFGEGEGDEEGDIKKVEELLREAMAGTSKKERDVWKGKVFGGEGMEEKNERRRAAEVAMGIFRVGG